MSVLGSRIDREATHDSARIKSSHVIDWNQDELSLRSVKIDFIKRNLAGTMPEMLVLHSCRRATSESFQFMGRRGDLGRNSRYVDHLLSLPALCKCN